MLRHKDKQSTMHRRLVYELCIETTKLLNKNQYGLANITWRNGEANIDTGFSKLACYCCTKAWEAMKEKYPQHNSIGITCGSPDVNITFTHPGGREERHKMELKSSTSTRMPGSTIRKLDVNQPLIYCLRPKTNTGTYRVRCSQYHHAMGETNTDLFQDRTPRPVVDFEKMKDFENVDIFECKEKDAWIDHYAKCALNRIDDAHTCQKSWQDNLVQKIIDEYIRKTSTTQFEVDKITLQVETTRL